MATRQHTPQRARLAPPQQTALEDFISRQALRIRMARAIEKLMAAIDAIDGDADFEIDSGDASEIDHDQEEQNEDGGNDHHGVPIYHSKDQRRIVTSRIVGEEKYFHVDRGY